VVSDADTSALLDNDQLKRNQKIVEICCYIESCNKAKSELMAHNNKISEMIEKLLATMEDAVATGTSILSMISSFNSVATKRTPAFFTSSQQMGGDSTDDDEDDNDNGGGSGGGTGSGAPTSNKRKRVDDTADGGGASAAAAAEEPTGYGWLNHAKFLQSVVNDDENPLSKK